MSYPIGTRVYHRLGDGLGAGEVVGHSVDRPGEVLVRWNGRDAPFSHHPRHLRVETTREALRRDHPDGCAELDRLERCLDDCEERRRG